MHLTLDTTRCWHIFPLLRMNLLEGSVMNSCRKCCFRVASPLRETKTEGVGTIVLPPQQLMFRIQMMFVTRIFNSKAPYVVVFELPEHL